MTPKHWTKNLNDSINGIPKSKEVNAIFASVLDLTILNKWKGACHESCGAIHILLNESGITNTWYIGEAKVGNVFFDHSWIKINDEIYDIAICMPLQNAFKNGPVIKNIDIDTNQATTASYGVVSGNPIHPLTNLVKTSTLSDYLSMSPMHPTLGTWILVDQIAKHKLGKTFNIPNLINKYNHNVCTPI
jgi:hypothetical protein